MCRGYYTPGRSARSGAASEDVDWRVSSPLTPAPVSSLTADAVNIDSPSTTSLPATPAVADVHPAPINVDHAELLLHFTATTAATLAGCECPDMLGFWTRNVPQIGLGRPFVLHLVLALAALHLAYQTADVKRERGADNDDDNDEDEEEEEEEEEAAGTAAKSASATSLCSPRRNHNHYLSLARQHLAAGVSGFSAQLSQPSPDNCGALYLGAVLTSYCTFAAGPTSRDDLLVCATVAENGNGTADCNWHDGGGSAGGGRGGGGGTSTAPIVAPASPPSSASWMPFVSGVRLMHESFSPDILFAGLMAPLRQGPPPPPLEKPVYARNGFPRLDWEAALDGLREFIAGAAAASGGGGEGEDGAAATSISAVALRREQHAGEAPTSRTAAAAAAVSLKALDALIGIYAAIYGRRGPDGEVTYDGPPHNQFVFGWLYRLEPGFVACVRRCEPWALLVLAHYAVLLHPDAIQRGWYVEGWRGHVVARVGQLLGKNKWMSWPMAQVAPTELRTV